MRFFERGSEILAVLGRLMLKHSKRIERSNERTIAYVKHLKSLADCELRKIADQEGDLFLRDTEKVRAAKFILCNRG